MQSVNNVIVSIPENVALIDPAGKYHNPNCSGEASCETLHQFRYFTAVKLYCMARHPGGCSATFKTDTGTILSNERYRFVHLSDQRQLFSVLTQPENSQGVFHQQVSTFDITPHKNNRERTPDTLPVQVQHYCDLPHVLQGSSWKICHGIALSTHDHGSRVEDHGDDTPGVNSPEADHTGSTASDTENPELSLAETQYAALEDEVNARRRQDYERFHLEYPDDSARLERYAEIAESMQNGTVTSPQEILQWTGRITEELRRYNNASATDMVDETGSTRARLAFLGTLIYNHACQTVEHFD